MVLELRELAPIQVRRQITIEKIDFLLARSGRPFASGRFRAVPRRRCFIIGRVEAFLAALCLAEDRNGPSSSLVFTQAALSPSRSGFTLRALRIARSR